MNEWMNERTNERMNEWMGHLYTQIALQSYQRISPQPLVVIQS